MSYTYSHVVLVGIDGAGIFFKNAKTPFIRKMFAEGAGTEKGLTVFPTESAQCWGTMLIGVMPEVHGLTMQNITADKYTKRAEHPDIFSLIKKYRPEAKTGSFCHWNDINVGIVDGVEGVVTERGQDEPLTEKACEYIKAEKPDFLFVHLDSVDDAGHGCGYNTEKYLKQLDIADGYAERIYNAVREAGIADGSRRHGWKPRRLVGRRKIRVFRNDGQNRRKRRPRRYERYKHTGDNRARARHTRRSLMAVERTGGLFQRINIRGRRIQIDFFTVGPYQI